MLRRTDTGYIERSILHQIEVARPSLAKKLVHDFPYLTAPIVKAAEVINQVTTNGNVEHEKKNGNGSDTNSKK